MKYTERIRQSMELLKSLDEYGDEEELCVTYERLPSCPVLITWCGMPTEEDELIGRTDDIMASKSLCMALLEGQIELLERQE